MSDAPPAMQPTWPDRSANGLTVYRASSSTHAAPEPDSFRVALTELEVRRRPGALTPDSTVPTPSAAVGE